jgi:type II secretory pathway predicted ATPase ExeA
MSPAITGHRTVLYDGQKRALAELMAGMDEDARWILLIGPEGIGKSTVLEALLTQLELTASDVVICEGSETNEAEDLLEAMRRQLQLPPPRRTLMPKGDGIADILASRRASKNPLAVLVDDAHHLSNGGLRLLAELASAKPMDETGIWVVLVGRPQLEERALRACGKAKGVRCRLGPLTTTEVAQYVERRIRDGTDKLAGFSDEAVAQIARSTRGVPRLINTLCDVVAHRPSARVANHVSAETVEEAARELGFDRASDKKALARDSVFSDGTSDDDEAPEDLTGRRRRLIAIALLTGVVAFGAGMVIYAGPMLTGAARTTFHRLFAGDSTTARAKPSTSMADNGGRSRQSRREASPPARAAQGPPAEGAPAPQQAKPRAAAKDRSDKASRPERPQPVAPTPEQVAAVIADASEGRSAELTRLLATGISPNVRDAYGLTPLMQAVQHGHVSAVTVLLDAGAQINARDRGGITPAMLAVINERTEALELLLSRGAEVNARTGAGWTALTFAAWKGDPDLVRVLLRHGATPNVVDKQGWSPLDYATAQLKSPSDELPPIDADFPAMTRGTRHSEVIPLLQGATRR